MNAPDTTTAAAPAKRLSLSQIVELLLSRGGGRDHSSVTLTRNSKGDTQIEVVVRTGDTEDVATIDAVTEKAKAIYDGLRDTYPIAATGRAPNGGES